MEKVEHVVLVDKKNNVLGTAPKLITHTSNTPLHRGFSLFIFNPKGQLLLQQRSKKKKTWPLIWSNSVCGHPMLNEKNIDAVKRRTHLELNIQLNKVHEILPDFSYKEEHNGIVENEICPVFVTFTDSKPILNKDEIEDIRWIRWSDFLKQVNQNPGKYSEWCEQEAILLSRNNKFLKLYKKLCFANN